MIDAKSAKAQFFLQICSSAKSRSVIEGFIAGDPARTLTITMPGDRVLFHFTQEEAAFLLAYYRMTTP